MLFECGEGTQRSMIFADISPVEITKIFLTHLHGDHCLGLPGLLIAIDQATRTQETKRAVEVYYPGASQKYFDNLRYSSIHGDKANIIPKPVFSAGVIYEDAQLVIEARPLKHRCPTFGYRVTEKSFRGMLPDKLLAAGIKGRDIGLLQKTGKLELNGKNYLLDDFSTVRDGKSFAFVMDTSICENAFALGENVDTLVCESTYTSENEAEAKDHAHMTAKQAALVAFGAKSKQLVLTHFSQRYIGEAIFLEEAQPVFPNVIAVKDGTVISSV